MTRVKRGTVTKQRHKRLLKKAKGFWGQRKNIIRRASETVTRALAFAYKGRRLLKRDMRALFITRISAAVEQAGLKYSTFMHMLQRAHIQINRKMLSQLAICDAATFQELIRFAQNATNS